MKVALFGPLVTLLASLVLSSAQAADASLDSLAERYSYAMGVRLAQALKSQGVMSVDGAALAAAIDDVLTGRPLRMNERQMVAVVDEQRVAIARANLESGRAYAAEFARRPGVSQLPGGVLYQVLASAEGERPGAGDSVRVHYHGTRVDGVVFDSSVARDQPAEFPLDGVIPGFRDAISAMRVGDRWRVVIPSELAYGERGAGGGIGPNQTLTFEIELLGIVR